MRQKITLASGGQVPVNMTGNYVYLDAATGPVEITVNGHVFDREQGQGFYLAKEKFKTLHIRDISGAINTIKIDIEILEDVELIDKRANVTNVEALLEVANGGVTGYADIDNGGGAILAANADNRQVTILSTNGDIFFAFNNAPTLDDFPLEQNAQYTWERFRGGLWGITAAGTVRVKYIISRVGQ